MNNFNQCFIQSPIGDLCLTDDGQNVVGVSLLRDAHQLESPSTALQLRVAEQLKAYFDGTLHEFNLPIRLIGSDFEQKVWCTLQQISYGTTLSYGDVATKIGQPKAARAVGGACHRNPILLLVPCHRVVGKSGALTGFGCGVGNKKILLDLEQKR